VPAKSTSPGRLVDVLRALPPGELDALVARLGVRIDPAKRLDGPAQIARALVALPELRDPSRLPPASVELLHRVAEARGLLVVSALPPAFEPLLARGLMFARGEDRGPGEARRFELIFPWAYLLQLRSWEGEDPRGLRALLAQAPFETTSAVAAHYLGRQATPPISLSLESAWEILGDEKKLEAELEKLAPLERRLLEAVEREGGEVETDELLELEREPLRLRTATGATPSRRGVGFSLERRALLVPVHPNRHVVPTEVARIIGRAARAAAEEQRAEVRSFVADGDHTPNRAKFAVDAAPLTVGLAIVAREPGNEVRAGIGTPKSLVHKLSVRFAREPEHVALIVALSRAIGLWDASATNPAAPPGSLVVRELPRVLFHAWRRGGAWDEARPESEMLRLAPDARDASPAGVVREMVLDALHDLGHESWIPWSALESYLSTDFRIPGLTRLFRRWSDRVGCRETTPLEIARRVAMESLPALGMVDLGDIDEASGSEDRPSASPLPDPEADTPLAGAVSTGPRALRLSSRGRSLLAERLGSGDMTSSKFLDTHVLRTGGTARLAALIALAPFIEIGRSTDTLDLIVSPQALARALSAGFDADALRQRIEAVAPLPESLSRTLAQASVVVGRGSFVPVTGFLWVEDPNVREMLRTRRSTAELFVDPSPPAGLLVASGVDLDRVVRRARTVGVEILVDGAVARARTLPPPPVRSTPSPGRHTPAPGRVTPAPGRVTPTGGRAAPRISVKPGSEDDDD
jgi:hypothetical protein